MKEDLTNNDPATDASTITLTLPPLNLNAAPAISRPTDWSLLPGDDTALTSLWDEADAAWQRQRDAERAAQREREERDRQAVLAHRPNAAAASRLRPYSYD